MFTLEKRHAALAALLALAVSACGGGDGGEEAAEEETVAEEAGPVVDPAVAASITGTIGFEGTPPEPRPVDMSEEPSCVAGYGPDGPRTQDVVVSDGRLANVFVYVKEGLDRQFPTPSEPAVLDQENCRYHPHVLGVRTGQTLLIKNSDDLLHNINARPETNRGFNISQPQAGMETEREFRVSEVMIPVKCDVHGWMNAYVGVLDHPYFAVSAEDGSFGIEELPPGEYVLEAWHERYGTQVATVTLEAQGTAEVSFTYSAEEAADATVPLGEPVVLHADD